MFLLLTVVADFGACAICVLLRAEKPHIAAQKGINCSVKGHISECRSPAGALRLCMFDVFIGKCVFQCRKYFTSIICKSGINFCCMFMRSLAIMP